MKRKLLLVGLILCICGLFPTQLQTQKTETAEDLGKPLMDLQKEFARGPLVKILQILQSVDSKFKPVIGYGKYLEKQAGKKNLDNLTIHSNEYWNALFQMNPDDPLVYLSRIILLVIDGNLQKAEYVFAFSRYRVSQSSPYVNLMKHILSRIKTIQGKSHEYVQKGIEAFDSGNKKEATGLYNKALKVYPKNPIALYEMGMTRIAMNPKLILQMKKDVDNYTYYVQARTHDPFMKEAHQGTNRITRKWLSIEKKIEPAMKALYSGTITCEALKSFAEGCIEIEQYEFAVYAYYQCMLNNYNQKTGFDLNLAEKISDCLVRLGAESAGNVFVRNIRKYNDVMKKQ